MQLLSFVPVYPDVDTVIQSTGRETEMKNSRKLLPAVIALVFLAIAAYGCGGDSQSRENGEEEKEQVVPVEVGAVKTGDISAYFTARLRSKPKKKRESSPRSAESSKSSSSRRVISSRRGPYSPGWMPR